MSVSQRPTSASQHVSVHRSRTVYGEETLSYEDIIIAKYLDELRKPPPYTRAWYCYVYCLFFSFFYLQRWRRFYFHYCSCIYMCVCVCVFEFKKTQTIADGFSPNFLGQ